MARWIPIGDRVYLQRGNHDLRTLRKQYKAYKAKYSGTMTFERWLVFSGKVYVSKKGQR
jgi:hypothetical protein